jgi:hypothetical protein
VSVKVKQTKIYLNYDVDLQVGACHANVIRVANGLSSHYVSYINIEILPVE